MRTQSPLTRNIKETRKVDIQIQFLEQFGFDIKRLEKLKTRKKKLRKQRRKIYQRNKK